MKMVIASNEVMMRWYVEKLVIFLVPIILTAVGISFRNKSFTIQKFISFPLIISCLTFLIPWSLITILMVIPNECGNAFQPTWLIKIIVVLLIGLIGLICGILINNRFLTIKFEIVSLNTIGIYIAVLIGFLTGIALFAFPSYFFAKVDKIYSEAMNNLWPFSYGITTLIVCLGGSFGAMLWSKKLKQKGNLL